MRRLTLILSDLYLPADALHEAAPAALALPNLEWFLRFANGSGIDSWRAWLARELGAEFISNGPLAQLAAVSMPAIREASSAWFATPVAFEARLDHVRMLDRGLLRVAPSERAEWCAEFARAFGPEYVLHDAGERSFLITGIAETSAVGVDPARVLGSDIAHALPSGVAAGELRRLMAEIEMWLHSAALNTVRERERRTRISALWLWGGGPHEWTLPAALGPRPEPSSTRLFGGDAWLTALAWCGRHSRSVAPDGFAHVASTASHDVVELAPISGTPAESLTALDAHWLGPARAALGRGVLDVVDIVANDLHFRVTARSSWKRWRRERRWLEFLERPLPAAKA